MLDIPSTFVLKQHLPIPYLMTTKLNQFKCNIIITRQIIWSYYCWVKDGLEFLMLIFLNIYKKILMSKNLKTTLISTCYFVALCWLGRLLDQIVDHVWQRGHWVLLSRPDRVVIQNTNKDCRFTLYLCLRWNFPWNHAWFVLIMKWKNWASFVCIFCPT